MANQLTLQQEDFCQHFATWGNGWKAYQHAYNVSEDTKQTTMYVNASKMLKMPHIWARVEELREEFRIATRVTVESLAKEFDEAREHALRDPKGSAAAVAASNAKAKLLGFHVERHEHSGPGGSPIRTEATLDVSGLSDSVLEELLSKLGQK